MKSSDLITEKTLAPGDPGTRKYVEKYGEKLLCIRHRYDRESKKKIKTVELVEYEKTCSPGKTRIPYNKIVFIKIKYGEIKLARIVKASGGKWNPQKRLWESPYGVIKMLGLTHRIVKQP
ncbi:hypothetical protein JW948_17085 [bacterium]|nr:hypothetical protein [bacterium]